MFSPCLCRTTTIPPSLGHFQGPGIQEPGKIGQWDSAAWWSRCSSSINWGLKCIINFCSNNFRSSVWSYMRIKFRNHANKTLIEVIWLRHFHTSKIYMARKCLIRMNLILLRELYGSKLFWQMSYTYDFEKHENPFHKQSVLFFQKHTALHTVQHTGLWCKTVI